MGEPREPTAAEVDEVRATTVALLQAFLVGDESGFDMLMGTIEDPLVVLAEVVGLAARLGEARYGHQEFSAALARWAPGCRIGDLP